MAETEDPFFQGVRSVMSIRCAEHVAVPQFNSNEASGGECAACAVEGVKAFLEVEREAGRIAREKSQFQFQRANALETHVVRLEEALRETAVRLHGEFHGPDEDFDRCTENSCARRRALLSSPDATPRGE